MAKQSVATQQQPADAQPVKKSRKRAPAQPPVADAAPKKRAVVRKAAPAGPKKATAAAKSAKSKSAKSKDKGITGTIDSGDAPLSPTSAGVVNSIATKGTKRKIIRVPINIKDVRVNEAGHTIVYVQAKTSLTRKDVIDFLGAKGSSVRNRVMTAYRAAGRAQGAIKRGGGFYPIPKNPSPEYTELSNRAQALLAEWGTGPIPDQYIEVPYGLKPVVDASGAREHVVDMDVVDKIMALAATVHYRNLAAKKMPKPLLKDIHKKLKDWIRDGNDFSDLVAELNVDKKKIQREKKKQEREEAIARIEAESGLSSAAIAVGV